MPPRLIPFALWFSLWILCSWPALRAEYWWADDFSCWSFTPWQLFLGGCYQGRPTTGLLYQLYFLAPPPDHTLGLILKFLQGALHALSATLLTAALRPHLGTFRALLCTLPFAVWGFQAEATLWFAGASYPLAVALAILGLRGLMAENPGRTAWRWWLGGLGIAGAVWSNQAPALAGASLWVILSALRPLTCGWQLRRVAWEAARLALAYGLALGVSITLMHYLESNRLATALDPWQKLQYLGQLQERLWFFPPHFTRIHGALHVILLSAGVLGLFAASMNPTLRRRVLIPGFLALPLLVALPFLANLTVAANDLAPRIFYAATLLAVGSCALAFALYTGSKRLLVILGGVLLTSACLHGILAYRVAVSFAQAAERERATLTQLEAFCAQHQTNQVLFMDWNSSGPWEQNPLHTEPFVAGQANGSVLQNIWWNYRYLGYYTELRTVDWWHWDRLRADNAHWATALPRSEPFVFVYRPEVPAVVVVPR